MRARARELSGGRRAKSQRQTLGGDPQRTRIQGGRRNNSSRQLRPARRFGMSLEAEIVARLAQARAAALTLALASTERKNRALGILMRMLRAATDKIIAANRMDGERARAAGVTRALRDRLMLHPDRAAAMARGVEEVIALPDPVGEEMARWRRPNGLEIAQVRVPLGVIALIYEPRPNVTVDAGVLGFKAGNAVCLRGGREGLGTNRLRAKP